MTTRCSAVLILAIVLTITSGGFAQGTGMLFAPQEQAPARLIQTTHGTKDLLISAKLKNDSHSAINSYTIGWAYWFGSKPQFHEGQPMNVPAGIRPGEVISVPAQNVPVKHGAKQVIFYVARLKFADGQQWRANRAEVSAFVAEHPIRTSASVRN